MNRSKVRDFGTGALQKVQTEWLSTAIDFCAIGLVAALNVILAAAALERLLVGDPANLIVAAQPGLASSTRSQVCSRFAGL
ncbi:hypothetical protein [Methylosinus sporium]|uniref:hypothetical protein n=1 Tax=Methylosinus sporium TaxID=428 RepID=UPI00383A421C